MFQLWRIFDIHGLRAPVLEVAELLSLRRVTAPSLVGLLGAVQLPGRSAGGLLVGVIVHLQLLVPHVLHHGRPQGGRGGAALMLRGCRASGGITVVLFLGGPLLLLLLDGLGAWEGGRKDRPAWTQGDCELLASGEAWKRWGGGVPLWALLRRAGAGSLVGQWASMCGQDLSSLGLQQVKLWCCCATESRCLVPAHAAALQAPQ